MNHTAVFSKNERILFITGILFFFLPKLINTYFLMPFPGSMDAETMTFSYWLDRINNFFLYAGALIITWASIRLIVKGSIAKKAGTIALLIACGTFYYFTVFKFSAEKMFKEPYQVLFKKAELSDYASDSYVLGIIDGNQTKAYPLKYLAYHHKINDRINNKEILVTYCSMCRSARVFSPFIDGEKVSFRLVGARHFNAVIEDSKTKTWWYQATGEAAAGPLKGEHLTEIPAEQTTWKSWITLHPATLLLLPDPSATALYQEWFEGFDQMRSPESNNLNKKVWVVGVEINNKSGYYKIPDLVTRKVINSQISNTPIVICLEKDSLTTHVWQASINNLTLNFTMDSTWTIMKENKSGSLWNLNGICISGIYEGKKLTPVQHYNEYLRSWEQFH